MASATKAVFLAEHRPRRGRPGLHRRSAGKSAGYKCGADFHLHGLDAASSEFFKASRLQDGRRGQGPRSGRHGRLSVLPCWTPSRIVSIQRMACEDDSRWLETADRPPGLARRSWSATTLSSVQSRAHSPEGHRFRAWPTPILTSRSTRFGTLSETAGRRLINWPYNVNAYCRGRDVPTVLARPRITDHSPTWPWRPIAGRSRPSLPSRPDCTAKYNQLLRIEEQLGDIKRSMPAWAR